MSKIKAVLFDLDGTLMNTLDDLADAVNFALDFFGFETHSIDKYRYFVGNGIPNLIMRATPENRRDATTLAAVKKKFYEYYNLHSMKKTRPYSGIPETLAALKKAGIKTAVVTNKDDAAAKIIINGFFPNSFDFVFGASEDIPKKPDPTIVRIATEKLGVTADECVFVGDSCVDMETAGNSGIYSVGVTWGFRPKAELVEYGASSIVDTPEEIISVIKKIG